jgi:hypothetical protein
MVHPLATRKEVPGTRCIGSLGSPQSHSRFFKIEKKKVLCLSGNELRLLGSPACSLLVATLITLYWLIISCLVSSVINR